MNPRISIIIPAYNAEKFLTQAIESVLCQTFSDWELIIVNDGSSDKTAEIMQTYSSQDCRIQSVSQTNQGVSKARNTGLALTKETPYVIFLDADDTWEPDALNILYSTFQSNPEHVGVYGSARYIDAEGARIRPGELEKACRNRKRYVNRRFVPIGPDEPTSFCTLLYGNCIHTPGVALLSREAIRRIGKFDGTVTHHEDLDYFIRMSRLGTFKFIDQVLLNYRRHGNNLSSQFDLMASTYKKVTKALCDSCDNNREQREAALGSYPLIQNIQLIGKLEYFVSCMRSREWVSGALQLKYAMGHFARSVRGRP